MEGVTRLQHGLRAEFLQLVDDALREKGIEQTADLGQYVPSRALVLESGGVEEIWCALSSQATDGSHVRDVLRDLLFGAVEAQFPEAEFEIQSAWPTGEAHWWEVVRLGLG